MDKLFEGLTSGMVVGTPGAYIKNPEGLYAGFLIEAGSCGESRSYALFEIGEDGLAVFSRFCIKPEKKLLAKAHYYFRAIKEVEVKTRDSSCILFAMRH